MSDIEVLWNFIASVCTHIMVSCTRQYTHTGHTTAHTWTPHKHESEQFRRCERFWVFVFLLEKKCRRQPKSWGERWDVTEGQPGRGGAGHETLKLLSPAHPLTGGGRLGGRGSRTCRCATRGYRIYFSTFLSFVFPAKLEVIDLLKVVDKYVFSCTRRNNLDLLGGGGSVTKWHWLRFYMTACWCVPPFAFEIWWWSWSPKVPALFYLFLVINCFSCFFVCLRNHECNLKRGVTTSILIKTKSCGCFCDFLEPLLCFCWWVVFVHYTWNSSACFLTDRISCNTSILKIYKERKIFSK